MAVGEIKIPKMKPIEGVRLSAVAAGIRYEGRDDLALIELSEGSVVGGCFTQNLYQAAPVVIARENLESAESRYLLVNSGNANACTGEQGMVDARSSCEMIAGFSDIDANTVLPFSTGVIGEHMNMAAVDAALPAAFDQLDKNAWEATAKAIMTTDTFPKLISREVELDGKSIRINGIAKGAGMIRPDMATMLAFVFTDAAVTKEVIQELCTLATDKSFNRITVDGDTSTNDSVILAATGKAGNKPFNSLNSEDGQNFFQAVIEVFKELAQLMVRDGEGATKFVTVEVVAGNNSEDCLQMAYCIAHSPLVKTAIYASDPNWGRLAAAIGRAGIEGLKVAKLKVWLDDVLVVEKGAVASTYTEEQGQDVFNRDDILIRIDMAMGDVSETIWTCDLSHEYVSINADYRS